MNEKIKTFDNLIQKLEKYSSDNQGIVQIIIMDLKTVKEKLDLLNSELSRLQTMANIKSRVQPTISAFATKINTPINGGSISQ